MNGQKPHLKTWKEVIEDLKIAVSNTAINLHLLQAQLKFAQTQHDHE